MSRDIPAGKKLNRPTPEGRECGAQLSELFDDADQTRTVMRQRCTTCAFRLGTIPNGCEATVMDALKCVVEGLQFNCHEQQGKACAGWLTMRLKEPKTVPWPYSNDA